ncbi:MAG: hypothetical protein LBG44_05750 [Gemmatimonadota bacterium]|jgi:hypothetical protein|nr:hypothetical protein [Gemmatimonadota bacterium]
MTSAAREEYQRKGLSQEQIYAVEARMALQARDTDTSLAWMRLVKIPAHALLTLKHSDGADYVRNSGLDLAPAEAAYGLDWLDNPHL